MYSILTPCPICLDSLRGAQGTLADRNLTASDANHLRCFAENQLSWCVRLLLCSSAAATFDQIDVNGDGVIDRSEFEASMLSQGEGPPRNDVSSAEAKSDMQKVNIHQAMKQNKVKASQVRAQLLKTVNHKTQETIKAGLLRARCDSADAT